MNEREPNIVRLEEVSKYYGGAQYGVPALRDISFTARAGELVLCLGPSGSGKTTFLTILAGLQRPTSGHVSLFGRRMEEFNPGEIQEFRARHLGFIFQTFLLLDSLTIVENVMIVRLFYGSEKKAARDEAYSYLERFGIKHLAGSYPSKVSQGEKQRAAIARAFINGAELIVADEPTGSLSSEQGLEIISYLRESSLKEKKCVVIASHDERIAGFADRVLHLLDGEIK